MQIRRLRRTPAAASIALLMAFAAAPAAAAPIAQDDVKVVAHFEYEGGTDLDFLGDYVYAGQQGDQGGVHVLDVSGSKPRKVGFISCPGSQNDVAMVKKGLLALGYHNGRCGKEGAAGVRLIDVKRPNRPRYLGSVDLPGGTHTITVYPGKPIIYASPGGLLNGGGVEQILDVSNPSKIEVAATFLPSPGGCHDVTFFFTGDDKLAFCPGLHGLQIWDVSDPLAPAILSHTFNPFMDFMHYAVPTPDGRYLVVSDENFEAHDCTTGQSPTGAMYVYDISDPRVPLLAGHYAPRRGAAPVGSPVTPYCTSHNMNFIPGTRILVSSWYTGGTSVIDFSNPALPSEITYYQPEDANTWSSYWYRGRIYSNDLNRGLEVLEIAGLEEGRQP